MKYPLVVLAFCAGIGGGVLGSQLTRPAAAAEAVLTVHDLKLVDGAGKVIAELGPSKGHAQLTIGGAQGMKAELGAMGLIVSRSAGRGSASIGFDTDKNGVPLHPEIGMAGSNPKCFSVIEGADNDVEFHGCKASIRIFDESENLLWSTASRP